MSTAAPGLDADTLDMTLEAIRQFAARVSAVTADLAAASGAIFHLLDLTPEPDPGDDDAGRVVADREGLKAALIERARAAGGRPTPAAIEAHLARLELAVDWTAWGGIGIASRGSIPQMMERAGIDMLAPEVGIPTVRRELEAGSARGEVLVAGRLGILGDEIDGTGGVDPTARPALVPSAGPMVGRVVGMRLADGLTVETTLDPAKQPFLDHHRIDGTPVLPGVMSVEAVAEVAQLPLAGWEVVGVDDIDFLAPCKFYRDEPRTLAITARHRPDGAGGLLATCALTTSRQLPGRADPQVTTHVTATVRLAPAKVTAMASAIDAAPPAHPDGSTAIDAEAVYRVYFHGPAYQVVGRAWRAADGVVGLLADDLPPDHVPAERPELVAPRLVELCFQTAGTWEIGRTGRLGLPTHVDRIRVRPGADETSAPIHAVVVPRADGGFDARVIDKAGSVLVELEGYRTVELPGAIDPERRAPLERMVG